MFESAIVLVKVAIVCGVGFAVATGFEWFSDMEVKPRNKTVLVGKEKGNKRSGEVSDRDSKVEGVKQTIRSAS